MALYLVNLDTVNVVSTMDTINSSGSYVGGSKTVSITSGENAIGTFGHTGGNYVNKSSAKSSASSTGSGGNTSAGNAAEKAALAKAKNGGSATQPSHTGSSPSTAPSTTSKTTDFCAWGGACLQLIMLV